MRLSALVTVSATLICALATALLLIQGRSNLPLGKAALVISTTALFWFLFRSIRHPYLRARPKSVLGMIATGIAGAYLLALVGLFLLQDKLLFIPVSGKFGDCENAKFLGYEVVDQKRGSERVRALVHQNAQARAWLIVFHGNAESACLSLIYSESLKDLPLNSAIVEYPGYQGDSTVPSQASLTSNANAAYDYLTRRTPGSPVFVLGRSLGTGIATFLASDRPVQGLVLISPYTSIADVGAFQYPILPVRLLSRNPFPAAEWARQVESPTLVLHGTEDRTIPFSIGKAESENFPHLERFVEMPGADHNSILGEFRKITWTAIHEFVAKRLSAVAR